MLSQKDQPWDQSETTPLKFFCVAKMLVFCSDGCLVVGSTHLLCLCKNLNNAQFVF